MVYRVIVQDVSAVFVEAENADEALEKFYEGDTLGEEQHIGNKILEVNEYDEHK